MNQPIICRHKAARPSSGCSPFLDHPRPHAVDHLLDAPRHGESDASRTKMCVPAPPSYPGILKPVCGYRRRVSSFGGRRLGSPRGPAREHLGLRAARRGEARRQRPRLLRRRLGGRGHSAGQPRCVRAAQASARACSSTSAASRPRPRFWDRGRVTGSDRAARAAADGASRR